ncbi:hypothetical protein L0F63_005529 [Massospora cicadina]|nr:hypothetical protein L0F63_005529 [Massospora cicadina]
MSRVGSSPAEEPGTPLPTALEDPVGSGAQDPYRDELDFERESGDEKGSLVGDFDGFDAQECGAFAIPGQITGPNCLDWSTDLAFAVTSRTAIHLIVSGVDAEGVFSPRICLLAGGVFPCQAHSAFSSGGTVLMGWPNFKDTPFEPHKAPVTRRIKVNLEAEVGNEGVAVRAADKYGSFLATLLIVGTCSLYASVPSLLSEVWVEVRDLISLTLQIFSFTEPLNEINRSNPCHGLEDLQEVVWSELFPGSELGCLLALGSTSGHTTLWSVNKAAVQHVATIVPKHPPCNVLHLSFSRWFDERCYLAASYGDGAVLVHGIKVNLPSSAGWVPPRHQKPSLSWEGSHLTLVEVEVGERLHGVGHDTLAIAKPGSLTVWAPRGGLAQFTLDSILPTVSLMWTRTRHLHAIDLDGRYSCFYIDPSRHPVTITSLEGKPSLEVLRDTLHCRLKLAQHNADPSEDEDDAPCSRFVRVHDAALSPNGAQVAILFSQCYNRMDHRATASGTNHLIFYDLSAFHKAIAEPSASPEPGGIPSHRPMCSFMWDHLFASSYTAAPTSDLLELIEGVLLHESRAWVEAPASPTTEVFAKMVLFLYHTLKATPLSNGPQFLPLKARAASLAGYNLVCHLLRLHGSLLSFQPPPTIQGDPFVQATLWRIHTIAGSLERSLHSHTASDLWAKAQLHKLVGPPVPLVEERCPICGRAMPFGNLLTVACPHGQLGEPATHFKRCQLTFLPIVAPYTMHCRTCGSTFALPSPTNDPCLEAFLEHHFAHRSPHLLSSVTLPAGWGCPHCAAQLY